MESNQNTFQANNIFQQDDASSFNSKQYKEDLQNLKAQFDQQQTASAPTMNEKSINNVQVPVVVPVEVPVPVPVQVPVYVPIAVPRLKQQEQEPWQQSSQSSDNNASNFNEIKKDY